MRETELRVLVVAGITQFPSSMLVKIRKKSKRGGGLMVDGFKMNQYSREKKLVGMLSPVSGVMIMSHV